MSDKNAFLRPYVETDAQSVERDQLATSSITNDISTSQINEFKDGVADGVIHGVKNEKQTSHYYKQGYDFGIYLYGELKIEENSE